MKKNQLVKMMILLLSLFGFMSTQVYADRNKNYPDNKKYQQNFKQKIPKNYRFDSRYQHDHYYPSTGFRLKRLPSSYFEIQFRSRPYYYNRGIWYLRAGSQFVVTIPPIGIVVPFLPNFYTTLWISGVPYYYANNVYYVWQPDRNGYIVTNPPKDINEEETRPLVEQLFIYPKQEQNEKQQADDRFQCHQWSVAQTNYDPSEPPENMKQSELSVKYENYQKAMKACLEGRGYSVR